MSSLLEGAGPEPLFPFYISQRAARMLVKHDTSFEVALEREGQFITELQINGRVEKDGTLHLKGWCSTDSGFCLTAGTFWTKEVKLSPGELSAYIDAELARRAGAEIAEEEHQKLQKRIADRVVSLRKELL